MDIEIDKQIVDFITIDWKRLSAVIVGILIGVAILIFVYFKFMRK